MNRSYSETLGQYLKRERESRSVSLEEISRGTRIGLPFLEALERNDFQFFPQREFLPGFIKGYARYLGLNLDEVLRRYFLQAEMEKHKKTFQQLSLFPSISAGSELQNLETNPPKSFRPKEKKRPRLKIYVHLIIIAIALSLSFYIHYLLKQIDNSPKGLSKDQSLAQREEGKRAKEKH